MDLPSAMKRAIARAGFHEPIRTKAPGHYRAARRRGARRGRPDARRESETLAIQRSFD